MAVRIRYRDQATERLLCRVVEQYIEDEWGEHIVPGSVRVTMGVWEPFEFVATARATLEAIVVRGSVDV